MTCHKSIRNRYYPTDTLALAVKDLILISNRFVDHLPFHSLAIWPQCMNHNIYLFATLDRFLERADG